MRGILAALGARPDGARGERVRRSPHFSDGTFHNTAPTRTVTPGGKVLRDYLFGKQRRTPRGEVPLVRPGAPVTDRGLHLTWYGHASALVEIEGRRVLIDPLWSDRCSPAPFAGPKRLHPMPVSLADLPAVDAVVISHDHYDHLDMPTIEHLTRTQSTPFLVPLGVGAHLDRWGVPADRIVELDWEESHQIGGLTLTATEAQHFSGRGLSRNHTLWSSWVIAGEHRRVFYTGDSGYFGGYAEIGHRHGPFDATLMQIGAYDHAWPQIHMFPEEAVEAHRDLGGGLLIPVHWATFNLALHAWSEPVERVWREAKAHGVALAVPRPGERVDVDAPPALDPWWQPLA
ncbi:Zn-dependent hydrolase [Catellatospora sp. TT07R-123]|uniref:MBL fold metallo-hydrolase n=1 Tax=Catellatospora sp. TT07R-123 TaxID=2733863 RepID=UPI001B297066|nr:MBL fold metallo-hydrolase [Catellatospora sp. TT07R-123]GHJ44266.1 Zn-dependent hydrolase [Catellatospora sp. TT07R-123]